MLKSLFIVLLLAFFSCQTNRTDEIENPNAIQIDLDSHKTTSSIIENIEYIPLETNNNVLIRHVEKLIFHDNKFYILDRTLSTIFIFHRDGSFYNKISRIGQGPGEYVQIGDFDVNKEDNTVWIYDSQIGKIIVYNETLTESKDISLTLYFEEFAIKGSDTIYVRNLYSEGKIHERIAALNLREMQYESLINKSAYEDDFDLVRFGVYMLNKSGDKLLFNPRFKNSILQLSNGKIEKVYDLIAHFPDESVIQKYKMDPDAPGLENYVLGICNIYENQNTVYIYYRKGQPPQGIYTFQAFYSKKTNQAYAIDEIDPGKYFANTGVIGVVDNQYVSYVAPASNLGKDFYRKMIDDSPLDQKNKSVLLNAKVSDNPILVLFDLIDF